MAKYFVCLSWSGWNQHSVSGVFVSRKSLSDPGYCHDVMKKLISRKYFRWELRVTGNDDLMKYMIHIWMFCYLLCDLLTATLMLMTTHQSLKSLNKILIIGCLGWGPDCLGRRESSVKASIYNFNIIFRDPPPNSEYNRSKDQHCGDYFYWFPHFNFLTCLISLAIKCISARIKE